MTSEGLGKILMFVTLVMIFVSYYENKEEQSDAKGDDE